MLRFLSPQTLEGFEPGNRNAFHQFLSIAKGSCAEVRSNLYIASDIGYLEKEQAASMMRDAEEVARILGGLRRAAGKHRKSKQTTQSPVLSPEFAPVAESGRRTGLKIPRFERAVPVRVRPGAPPVGKVGKDCKAGKDVRRLTIVSCSRKLFS